MKTIRNIFDRYFPQQAPIPPGVYHYQSPPEVAVPFRLHLRVEEDGTGLLIVNASTVLHLNQTAAEYAYHLLKQSRPGAVAESVSKRYRVSLSQALADFHAFSDRVATLVETPDLDPSTYLDFDRTSPHSQKLMAPLRLDCALTYETVEGHTPDAPNDRVKRNLSTEEWKTILDKAWKAGIPHVIFTGGEPTQRPDLVELISYAEQLGMVAGLLSCGLRLSETAYLHQVLQAGLDHLMLVLDPQDEQSWEALRDTLAEDLFVTVHLTITEQNAAEIPNILDRLASMRVPSLSLSESSGALKAVLDDARDLAAHHQIQLVWDLPVPYSHLNPVSIELQAAGEMIAGAARSWLYVEPDGDVLPRQGLNANLGNLLTDPWEQIWQQAHEVAPA
ncbi:MAG TPA: radical SAM protein [Anaerolineae bacterium]|nr:radical SAM protein [Anaerolineae bacterium]